MSEHQVVTGTLVRSVRRPARVKSPRGLLGPMPKFWNEAECGGSEQDLFFPPGGAGVEWQAAYSAQVEEAKAICRRCPVQAVCRDWALSVPERYGIWGGMTQAERVALLRKLAKLRGQEASAAAKTVATCSGTAKPVEAAQSAAVAVGGRA